MISTEAELRREMATRWSGGDALRVLPAQGLDGSDGCIVVEHRSDRWKVYRMDRGPQDIREFDTAAEAFDFAYRRWVLWDEDA